VNQLAATRRGTNSPAMLVMGHIIDLSPWRYCGIRTFAVLDLGFAEEIRNTPPSIVVAASSI
jgi:hypothetical protein